MKKVIRTLLIAVMLLLALQAPAQASNLQDSLVPQEGGQKQIGEVQLLYNQYPLDRYQLDTYIDTSKDWMPWKWAEGAGKQVYIALSALVNALWQLSTMLSYFTMAIVQEAFKLDFVSNVVNQIGAAIQGIAGFGPGGFVAHGLWPLLITFVVCLVGGWAAYMGMVKRETSRAWGGLISAVVILVFSLGFFSHAGEFLGGLNKWSSDLQSNILATSASIVNPGADYTKEEGIASIRNQMFDLMIKKPYLLMQYGTTKVVPESRVEKILSIDPYANDGQARQTAAADEVKNYSNTMMSSSGVTQRAAFVPLLFIGNTVIGLFLLLISGLIILYQILFLVLALFAPVALLLAMIPTYQQTAVNWLTRVLHAQLMKIGIALLLTILFGVSAILYRATETSNLGYLGMMVIQIICFVGIFVKRHELFSLVSTSYTRLDGEQALQNVRRRLNQEREEIAGRVRDYRRQQTRSRTFPLMERSVSEREYDAESSRNSADQERRGRRMGARTSNLVERETLAEQEERRARERKRTKKEPGNGPARTKATGWGPPVERELIDPAAQDKVTSIDAVRTQRSTAEQPNPRQLADRKPLTEERPVSPDTVTITHEYLPGAKKNSGVDEKKER